VGGGILQKREEEGTWSGGPSKDEFGRGGRSWKIGEGGEGLGSSPIPVTYLSVEKEKIVLKGEKKNKNAACSVKPERKKTGD